MKRALLPILRAAPRVRGAAYAVSTDDPSDARPPTKQPPMSRVAPTPPKETTPTMEEPALGKSNLLINDGAEVRPSTLPHALDADSIGAGYTRSEICRWAWVTRTDGQRTTDEADEFVPVHPGRPWVRVRLARADSRTALATNPRAIVFGEDVAFGGVLYV
jgi:hypothetical protein